MLMSESKHTPGPWKLAPMAHGHSVHIEGGKDTETIASAWATKNEQAIANAEFIVRACNAHDDMLAALIALTSNPRPSTLSRADDDEWAERYKRYEDAFNAARAAIAKAKGEA